MSTTEAIYGVEYHFEKSLKIKETFMILQNTLQNRRLSHCFEIKLNTTERYN
jgi:hypothetical protein